MSEEKKEGVVDDLAELFADSNADEEIHQAEEESAARFQEGLAIHRKEVCQKSGHRFVPEIPFCAGCEISFEEAQTSGEPIIDCRAGHDWQMKPNDEGVRQWTCNRCGNHGLTCMSCEKKPEELEDHSLNLMTYGQCYDCRPRGKEERDADEGDLEDDFDDFDEDDFEDEEDDDD